MAFNTVPIVALHTPGTFAAKRISRFSPTNSPFVSLSQSNTNLTVDSAINPTVDGEVVKNKLELTLAAGTQLATGKNYVLEVAADKVADS